MGRFVDYWARLQAKNPGLASDESTMKITVASFRKSLEQAHEDGQAGTTKILDTFADKLKKAILDKLPGDK